MDDFLTAHPEVNDAVAFALKQVADARPADPVEFLAASLRKFSTDKETKGGTEESKLEGKDDDVQPPRRYARRSNVFSEPVRLDASWKPRTVDKDDTTKASLHEVICKNILFASMDTDQRNTIVDAMEEKTFEAGATLIKQGDPGDFYYVLSEGTCDIFKDGELVLQCSSGMGFGELALMYDAPRAATVQATSDVKTWAIDRMTFKQVMMGTTTRKRDLYREFLEAVPMLSTLSPEERLTVADALVSVQVDAGAVVVAEGDTDADRFYIVEEGELKGTKGDVDAEVCPRLTRGDYFGEIALITDKPRAATITAVSACIKSETQPLPQRVGAGPPCRL